MRMVLQHTQLKKKGEWMISVVKMELFTANDKADYDSYWGSYTFSNYN